MKCAAIVTAAGRGTRMASDMPKQFMPLSGIPILARTLMVFDRSPRIDSLLPVVPDDYVQHTVEKIVHAWKLEKCLPPIAGGTTRQDSVRKAFESLPRVEIIVIHDGVRPFVDEHLIEQCLEKASAFGAAICAVRAKETVKTSRNGQLVGKTLDRAEIWLAQTPQAFRREVLEEAYRKKNHGREYTDEACLVEEAGFEVSLVQGLTRNIKITSPEDMIVAEAFLSTPGL